MEDNTSKQASTILSGLKTVSFPEEKKIFSQRQVIKNLTVICIGFVLLFTAYNGLSMLQSTMNQQQGIGVASQAIIYAGFCVSALLLPKYMIKKLGCKRTLLLSMSCYIPYVAANFYFNWMTMVPSALLVGLAASLLWSSQCTYFNESASIYSILDMKKIHDKQKCMGMNAPRAHFDLKTDEKIDLSIVDRRGKIRKLESLDAEMLQNDTKGIILCNSVACLNNDCLNKAIKGNKNIEICHVNECALSTVTSNNIDNNSLTAAEERIFTRKFQISESEECSKLVSSVTARFFGLFGLAFRTSDIWSNLMSYYVLHENNVLDNITGSGNCSCGAAFCNVESNCFEHNLAEPSQQMRNILTGVSVMLAFFGILLVFLFLDDLEMPKEPVKFSFSFAMATCKFVRKKQALLLFPLSCYIGFQQGFYIGDFTKSYIACAWGVYHVGLVTICYGVAAGIASTLAGFLVKYIGRIAVMLIGAAINTAINVFLLFWNPLPDQSLEFFVSAAVWGISVGIMWSQLRAYYGVIFKKDEEAAFAGFYLWDSIGYCIAFSYSNYICTYIKIYILLVVSTLGIIGYLMTEVARMQESKELKNSLNQ